MPLSQSGTGGKLGGTDHQAKMLGMLGGIGPGSSGGIGSFNGSSPLTMNQPETRVDTPLSPGLGINGGHQANLLNMFKSP
jgi:hypothetical protein